MTSLRTTRLVSLIAAIAALLIHGCGSGRPKTAPVRGTVTYKGKPVPNGSIMFMPEGGTAATAEIGPDGTYTLTTFDKGDGAILGEHKVTITAMQDLGPNVEAWTRMPPPIIPVKYMNPLTSDLTAEVKDTKNEINFDLK